MRHTATRIAALATLLASAMHAQTDFSEHKAQFITVDDDVKLEVLDWGGSGRPLLLLAGNGNTAHVFDAFAAKLTADYHVYGITRRGFGSSSAPTPRDGNYSADRLGDDVLAVMDALKLNKPVLVGHSLGGEELSSVGSRHPKKVAGLVYLDAAYSYAYYDRRRGDARIDSLEVRKQLEQLIPGKGPQDPEQVVEELLRTLPRFERSLREWHKDLEALPPLPTPVLPELTPAQATLEGQQKYTSIPVPALAIFASPPEPGPPYNTKKLRAWRMKRAAAQAKAFKAGVPSARVVLLPHSKHFVFISNEADVLREMKTFIGSLP